MGCDSFVLSIRTQYIGKNLNNHEFFFDFSNLNENHELFSNKKTVVGEFNLKLLKMFGQMNSLVWDLKLINLNVMLKIEINWGVFPNLNRKILNLKKVTFS